MRISDNMAVENFLRDLEKIRERLFERSARVSSGKKLRRPSQDPQGSDRVIRIRDQVSRVNQYFRNIQRARLELTSTENVLTTLRESSTTVIQKVQQGLNDIITQDDRDMIAMEIEEILGGMFQLSTTSIDGKRLFSGGALSTDPVLLNAGTYSYQGDGLVRMVEIAENQKIQTNVLGSTVFTGAGSDLLNTVKQLADALRVSDTSTATALLDKMHASIRAIDLARTTVGVTLNKLDSTKALQDQLMLSLTIEASNLEDADLAKAISEMTQSETALSAILAVGSRQRTSLFDFFG